MNKNDRGTRARMLLVAMAAAAMLDAGAAQKFDAYIGRFIAEPASAQRHFATAASRAKADRDLFVETLVRFEGEGAARMAGLGARVRSVVGDIAAVDVPLSLLEALASLPEVAYVEAARPQPLRLNFSVPATRANLLRSGTAPNYTGGLTGRGVIVGIIDDGLDFRHLDFRNADGTTRLLGLWDQRAAGAAGAAPTGYTYGGECTPAMLNAAIGGDAAACTQPSTGNHGTHVGGIAAGNGQQTGNGAPAYRFVGMAPEADLLAANSIGGGVGASNAIVDAIAWMKAKAAAAGKPLVINLSLGSYFGARDGTSNYERALSGAGGAGVILVAAGGNEGSDRIRAVGTISQAQTAAVTFNWPASVTAAQKIEMWYPGANRYAVRVVGPNGCETAFVAAGATQSFSPATTPACGTIEIASTAAQSSNDDRQIVVDFAPNGAGMAGGWTIEIRGDAVAAPSTPFSLICGETGNGLVFTSNTETVTRAILTDTASATNTIGVAAYNTNYSWQTTGGAANAAPNHGPVGDVSTFSSRGPRRDCSNAAKCPAAMKPEITAPGAMIMAALGQDASAVTDDTIERDGKHVAYNGTSMATPHVSGAVALMLQRNGALTPQEAKRLLAQNRQANQYTDASGLPVYDPASPLMPASPNYAFGYGILDAQAAANAIAGTAGLAASPAAIDFGGQSINTTSPAATVTVTNNSNASVTITAVTASAGFGIAASTCGALPAAATCSLSLTFTPAGAGAATGTAAITHAGGTLGVALAGTGERSLVTHYYRSILRRAPDAGGKAFWESEAARMAGLGANVNETWYALAMTFYFSGEYAAQNRNPTEYLRDLYGTFYNRSADNEGLAFWAGQLSAGLSRESVLNSFMFSAEFANFTRAIFGNTAVRPEVDTVADFYRGLLSRLPDTSGFNFFVGQFRQAQCAGAAAVLTQVENISSGYANSAEYAARNRTHEQYVSDLFNAFLRRGADLEGFRFWVSQIASGARTRDTVRREFMASPEFNARVAAITNAGCRQ